MSAKISPGTRRVLQRFVDGRLSDAELDDWLTGAEYDSALDREERDALAGVRLTLIEVSEGISKPDSLSRSVAALLAGEKPSASRRSKPLSRR